MKENAELKKRCKELEEKLANVETKPREDDKKDQEIADLKHHWQDAESRAVELEKVVAEKEVSLQAKSKEEQLMLMRSKELEEERSGLIEKCRQLEETLANGSKESEERGEIELEKELALAKKQRTEATEEAKVFKEKFKELRVK